MDRTLRLILTMLALVAGFAVAPAQARMTPAESAEVERVDIQRGGATSAAQAAQAEVQAQARGERRDADRPRSRRSAAVRVLIPSIQYGDRLLE